MSLPAVTPRTGTLQEFVFEAEYEGGERREFPILARDRDYAWLEAVNRIIHTGPVAAIQRRQATPP